MSESFEIESRQNVRWWSAYEWNHTLLRRHSQPKCLHYVCSLHKSLGILSFLCHGSTTSVCYGVIINLDAHSVKTLRWNFSNIHSCSAGNFPEKPPQEEEALIDLSQICVPKTLSNFLDSLQRWILLTFTSKSGEIQNFSIRSHAGNWIKKLRWKCDVSENIEAAYKVANAMFPNIPFHHLSLISCLASVVFFSISKPATWGQNLAELCMQV